MIDKIDLCVSFIGENSGVLARLFFGTLRKYCDLYGNTRIVLHLVNKQLSNSVWLDVLEHAVRINLRTYTYALDTGWNPYRGTDDVPSETGADFHDAARTAEWCVDNCGNAGWCVLSHFDVVWRSDILKWLVEKQRDTKTAMVGSHCPVMLLNRPAYHRLGIGFDSRGAGDVGHALARAIGAVGFPDDPDMEWCFHHLGGGGGYHSCEEFESMRDRAIKLIEEEGL